MNILADVHKWQDMDGMTPAERRLNAYLCVTFVMRHGIPSDECLNEAMYIMKLDKRASQETRVASVVEYLQTQYSNMYDDAQYPGIAEKALALAAGKAVWP